MHPWIVVEVARDHARCGCCLSGDELKVAKGRCGLNPWTINWGDERLPERFWKRTYPIPFSGCWLWVGRVDKLGYGQFDADARGNKAHRYAYQHLVGPVPAGLELDHLCRVRACCNPQHLEAVTHAENMRRGAHALKTHCPSGHAYADDNTFIRPDPKGDVQRVCRQCRIERGRAYRARRGAVPRKGRAA